MCNPYKEILNLSGTLLVLATSPSPLHVRTHFTNNVILNWSKLRPWIQPVMFVDDIGSSIAEMAKQNGWLIRPVPRRRSNIPVFKDLILETSTINPSSPLVGFANDDILFAYNIITTIAVILESLVTIREQFVFITGRRRNVDGELIGRIDDVDCPQIVYLLGKDRSAFSQDSADYFLFSSNTVRKYWAEMPEFVIGRAGYDNWIISSAVARNATAIEATETITALHQTGEDGIRSGVFLPGHKNRTDLNLNRDLIPDFDYSAGYQYCNGWMTNSVCSERRYQFKSLPKRCITLTKRTRIK
ncbi:hypothetical protein LSH36_1635g00002 [Paralvinella palmiformis]|uniref:Uncharacterized protein n=1 Tax=Paralvinella palmiformis TaxID=53620 RepID=A0AAD9IS98_9ANNE|nr:hypothetical protein LSH36_1635g00002 [Paralvinella palmiformis]